MTSRIDREDELARGKRLLLDRNIRLVTLTCAPGTGKSRLAVVVAAAVAQRFAEGVWFVPPASLARTDLVIPAARSIRAWPRPPAVCGTNPGACQEYAESMGVAIAEAAEPVAAAAAEAREAGVEVLEAEVCPALETLGTRLQTFPGMGVARDTMVTSARQTLQGKGAVGPQMADNAERLSVGGRPRLVDDARAGAIAEARQPCGANERRLSHSRVLASGAAV